MDWKEWHRALSDILGCEYLERTVTLEKARELVDRLARIEQACLVRNEINAPEWATHWCRWDSGDMEWWNAEDQEQYCEAPNLRPDTDQPLMLPIIDC